MNIIRANKSHLNTAWKLMQQLFLPNIDCYWCHKDNVQREILTQRVFLLKDKGVYKGLIELVYVGEHLQIWALVVDSKYRKCGLGEVLVDFAKKEMVRGNFKGISLLTMLQYRVTKFYERMGFIKTGRGQYDNRAYNEYYFKKEKYENNIN